MSACICGNALPIIGGAAYVCTCGRKYGPPTADGEALIRRIDELQARLEAVDDKLRQSEKLR